MLTRRRPKSKNATWEDPPLDGAPFDPDAKPSTFYFDVESTGTMELDEIVKQGVSVLQQKLAAVIQGLTGADQNGARGNEYEQRSPDTNAANPTDLGMGDGYTSSYPGAGDSSVWGSMTPFGATGYGQPSSWPDP